MKDEYLQQDNSTTVEGAQVIDGFMSTSMNGSLVTNADNIWPWRIGLFGVGGACIGCVGVVCNCITIVVLAHYKSPAGVRSSAPLLLIFLEIFDTLYLILELLLENFVFIAQGGLIDNSYRTFITPVYCVAHPAPSIAWLCGTFMVVVITLERYIVVGWPLSAHRICRPAMAKLAALVVLLGAMIYHVPDYLAFTCPKVWNNATQSHVRRFRRTEFGASYYYTRVHTTWGHLTVRFLIPFAVLLTFNTLLLRALWRSDTSLLRETQGRIQAEKKLTVMVVCMTAIFFLCGLFAAISFILVTGLNAYTECSMECNRFTAIASVMTIVNAASNFVIYCGTGQKFREVFCQLFLKRPPRSGRDASSSQAPSRARNRLSEFLTRSFIRDLRNKKKKQEQCPSSSCEMLETKSESHGESSVSGKLIRQNRL